MEKTIKECSNQLTIACNSREELSFAIKQLEKYGDVEGRDFEVRPEHMGAKKVAVYINRIANNAPKLEKRLI